MSRVAVLLRGGLGNQLFQVAAAMNIPQQRELQNLLLLSYGNEWGDDHPSVASLLEIPVTYPDRWYRSTIPALAVRESWRDSISRSIAAGWGTVSRTHVIRQSSPFEPMPSMKHSRVFMDGYFQHPTWWTATWGVLARHINDRQPIGVQDLRTEQRTVLKVRRSDYVGRGISLAASYFEEALDALNVTGCPVTVVCEEPDIPQFLSKLLIQRECTVVSPEPLTGNPNLDHFWHLASGRRLILANSSYCWWGAAVGEQAGVCKEVVFPEPWLPNAWGSGAVPGLGLQNWIPASARFE